METSKRITETTASGYPASTDIPRRRSLFTGTGIFFAAAALVASPAWGGGPSSALLDAIRQVESGGRGAETPDGDGGKAIGAYQIHRAYWQDATEWLRVDWPYADARDPVKARRAVVAYMDRYGRNFQRETGREATAEVYARMHNGGPRGWKKKATLPYWNRVKRVMEDAQ